MRVLVTGAPRSGTTWIGSVLGATAGAGFLHEPDSISWRPFSVTALRGLTDSPMLGPDSVAPRAYTRLWDSSFGAPVRYIPGQQRVARALYEKTTPEQREAAIDSEHPRETLRLRLVGLTAVPPHLGRHVEHQVVKSVRLPFALEWVAARWQPAVVVCFRHPLDIVASALALQWSYTLDSVPPALRSRAAGYGVDVPVSDDLVTCTAWWVGMYMSALDEVVRTHPEFHAVDHAEVCDDPVAEFRRLIDALGLVWTPAVEELIVASNRSGTGYDLNRVAAEQRNRWRERLSPDDARTAAGVLARFPIVTRYPVTDLL